jgi:hypothetical protein
MMEKTIEEQTFIHGESKIPPCKMAIDLPEARG